jgi:hypothetical protein
MQYSNFVYNDAQAKITAKWEVGVRNYFVPVAVIPYGVPIALDIMRIAFKWNSFPALAPSFLTTMSFSIYFFFLLFIVFRLKNTEKKIKSRRLRISFDSDAVVIKDDEKAIYAVQNEDIGRVDTGQQVMRIATEYGAVCLPLDIVPQIFIDEMKKLGRQYREHRWM